MLVPQSEFDTGTQFEALGLQAGANSNVSGNVLGEAGAGEARHFLLSSLKLPSVLWSPLCWRKEAGEKQDSEFLSLTSAG